MPKYNYINNWIHCLCGEEIPAPLEDHLSDSLWMNSFDTDLAEEEQYKCPKCACEFNLELRVEKTVVVTYQKIELIGQLVEDIDGDEWDMRQFENMTLLDKAPLPDGVYIYQDKEYLVKNQIVMSYWAVTDNDQMSLFEEIAA